MKIGATTDAPMHALEAASPELLSGEEKLVWLLGDLMNAVENYFGAENPKRLGHINSAAIRIIDEVLTPAFARVEALEAALAPFAEDAERLRNYGDDYPYSFPITPITVGDLRRARALTKVPS